MLAGKAVRDYTNLLVRMAGRRFEGQKDYDGAKPVSIKHPFRITGSLKSAEVYGEPGVSDSFGAFLNGVMDAIIDGEQPVEVRWYRYAAHGSRAGDDCWLEIVTQKYYGDKPIGAKTYHIASGINVYGARGGSAYRLATEFVKALMGVYLVQVNRQDVSVEEVDSLEKSQALELKKGIEYAY